jgi:RNA polymerase sigma factor FliA
MDGDAEVTDNQRLGGLWARLTANANDTAAADELVREYLPLVRAELSRARARFPKHVDRDELETSALEGLYVSVRSFDPTFGVSFESYARKRIWGSILDRVRSLDGIPRSIRRATKTLNEANQRFVQEHGRRPDWNELAEEAGVDESRLSYLQRQAQFSNKLSLDAPHHEDMSFDGGDASAFSNEIRAPEYDNPLKRVTDTETKKLLVEGMQALDERERAILVLYYHEGIMFNEIAAAMNVSESRISQLHSRALDRLKRYITCDDARRKSLRESEEIAS